jgi:hypothetical protein
MYKYFCYSDYQQAQENVNRIVTSTDDELKTIKKKINVYEDELIKLEVRSSSVVVVVYITYFFFAEI